MILAHRTLNFLPCNTKQEINLTLPKNKDEKLQYNINREAAKLSALSSGKIDKVSYR